MRRISERNYIVAMCQKSTFAFWILADEKTIFVVNHFSHNAFFGHDHEELCAEAAKYGFVVSYDGLEIEF